MVRDDVEAVIEALRALEAGHRAEGRDTSTRSGTSGSMRSGVTSALHPTRQTPTRRRWRRCSIYLNRTGYNGLFRVNSRGAFNVPVGRYARVTICDAANLRRLSAALRRPGLSLDVRRFEAALGDGRPGTSSTSIRRTRRSAARPSSPPTPRPVRARGAVAPAAGRHRPCAPWRARPAQQLDRAGHPRLYADNVEARSAGLRARTVEARRAINSRAAGRGPVREYLITNIV